MGTIIGAFETREMAASAADELIAAGFRPEQISVLGRHGEITNVTPENETMNRTVTGAGIGAAIGGFGSLLLGAAALAIPGVGPLVAIGPLSGALSAAIGGGFVGGIIGFLTGEGVPEHEASRYAERIHAGAYLVAVHPDSGEESRAKTLLAIAGAEAPIRDEIATTP